MPSDDGQVGVVDERTAGSNGMFEGGKSNIVGSERE